MNECLEDAWATYDRSFERLASSAESINERIRQAFEAGYESARILSDADGG